MNNNPHQPRKFDAVLGGEHPIITDAVLGGIKSVNNRLSSTNSEAQIAALKEAFNYGEKGLDLVIGALEHESVKVQRFAAKLLKNLGDKKVKLALEKYKFWNKFENYYKIPCDYATTFANRKVIEFDPKIGIDNTANVAYALRVSLGTNEENIEKMQLLLKSPFANKIEALVFGNWYTNFFNIVDLLLEAQDKLTNLKALFIGDVNLSRLYLGSDLDHNISYILLAYPELELLKFRCHNWSKPHHCQDLLRIKFTPVKHERLKTLIIESYRINNYLLKDFFQLELPALEYLELWGADVKSEYNSQIGMYELVGLLTTKLPKLKYLGLHKHNGYNDLAFALANSPILENLVELDLSVGGINDIGLEALFKCPALRELDTFDISYNCINYEMIEKMNKLDINFICKSDNPYDYRYYPANE